MIETKGDNYCLNGDLYELLPMLSDNSMGFICIDLPYGVTQNKKDILINPYFLWSHLDRVALDDKTPIILTSQLPFTKHVLNSIPKKYKCYDLLFWHKKLVSNPLNANRQPMRVHEHVLVCYKKQLMYNPQFTEGKPQHSKGTKYKEVETKNQNYGDFKQIEDYRKGNTKKYPQSIIEIQKVHPSKSVHPTEKPIELAEWLIKTYARENVYVLDTCGGVGWTAIAAFRENLNFVTFDINATYHEITKSRLEKEGCADFKTKI